jgi:predicted SprT family Zn-dependent metalloprotease
MKLNILGTEYELKVMTETEYPKLKLISAYGLCEQYAKELIINKKMYEKEEKDCENLEKAVEKVIRHEIVHAFIHESGLTQYFHDETIVEWLAIQIPKMAKEMVKADALSVEEIKL